MIRAFPVTVTTTKKYVVVREDSVHTDYGRVQAELINPARRIELEKSFVSVYESVEFGPVSVIPTGSDDV